MNEVIKLKIVITNTNCSWNKGSAAQVISTYHILKKSLNSFDMKLFSHFPSEDKKSCGKNIDIITSFWWKRPILKYFGYFFYRIIFPFFNLLLALSFKFNLFPSFIKIVEEYYTSDLVLDLSGDSYSDSEGGFSIANSCAILPAIVLNKPIILYSQSIGPFNSFSSYLAKFCMNRAVFIIIREEISKNYLEEMGIKTPIYLAPDCAFILEPSPDERIKEILEKESIEVRFPLVGVSVNSMFLNDENYLHTLSKLIDYMIEKYNLNVLLIPHVISLSDKIKGDEIINKEIYSRIKYKENVNLIQGDYSPNELKGIIKLVDVFIGGRMHANIAAISNNIPTLATSWSHKYQGIMKTLGQENYVINIENIEFDALKLIIDDLWSKREKIKKELEVKVEEQKKLVWNTSELITSILN